MTRSINLHWLGWAAAGTLLAVPFLAGAPWSPADYAFAAVMLGVAGGAIELGHRASTGLAYRAATLIAVAAAFLLVWINAAVGFFGSEDNDVNAVFALVLLVAVGGTLLARLRARGGLYRGAGGAALGRLTRGTGEQRGAGQPEDAEEGGAAQRHADPDRTGHGPAGGQADEPDQQLRRGGGDHRAGDAARA